MGVQIYLLDRRKVTLLVDDLAQEIGILRRSWKVTEMDSEREQEIVAAQANLEGKAAPVAVMIADVGDFPLAAEPNHPVAAHMVLGWDADRSSVTDFDWDYLPILGYAVKRKTAAGYVLHEEAEGCLSPITRGRAIELGIYSSEGKFLRQGQPSITECNSVRPYVSGYARADCVLSNGRDVEILTLVTPGSLPAASWYIGKRPASTTQYLLDKDF